ncbi:MAG: type II secretion system F family protein, partial [Planctomycetota bacterium]
MPSYRYIARNTAGERIAGVLAAASEQAALSELEAKRLLPIDVSERTDRSILPKRRVSTRRLALTYSQLGEMLSAGVPILRALRLLGKRKGDKRLSVAVTELAEAVAEGDELALAMSRRPDVFKDTQVAIIRAGEKGGFLENACHRLCKLLEAQADLKAKLLGALTYPAAIISIGFIVLAVVFVFFIPMIRPMFARFDDLPFVTTLVLGLGDFVTQQGVVAALLAIAILAAGSWYRSTPAGRARIGTAAVSLPAIGPLVRSVVSARVCRLLGTLLESGVPMLSAMAIARQAADNPKFDAALESAIEAVRAGDRLAPSLASAKLFDEEIVEMIAVGEESGRVDRVLLQVAETLENRVDRLLGNVIKLVEPIVLFLIAIGVAIIAVGLILPLT